MPPWRPWVAAPSPLAPKGNIATEDLVNMCEKMGIHTGYNLEMLTQAARDMCEEIHAHLGRSMALAATAKMPLIPGFPSRTVAV